MVRRVTIFAAVTAALITAVIAHQVTVAPADPVFEVGERAWSGVVAVGVFYAFEYGR